MIDLWTSRRDTFIECQYWLKDENELVDNDELAYKRKPSGFFFAKETNAQSYEMQVLGEFSVESGTVMLETHDNVGKLTQNDLVKYQGEMWRVDNIQKKAQNKQKMYLITTENSYTYYISLRK